MIGSFFSLRKSRKVFREAHRYFSRKAKSLDQYQKETIQGYLKALQSAILQKDSQKAKQMAKELEESIARALPKSHLEKALTFIGRTLVALAVAVLIRTMWFELYVIPTGSMRPTLKEEDYLVVSKTDYGINVPLQESHFYFDPNLVQRGSIIVFNGANMDIQDNDTVYFYLFPGKKQFVKRLIGKPGDTIYFYGGHLYGIDAQGNAITAFNEPWFQNLEHIPFIRFEGRTQATQSGLILHQMNQPVAKFSPNGKAELLGKGRSQYTGSDSKIGRCQGGALNLNQRSDAEAAKLNKLSDAGGFKFGGCPTPAEPIFESRAVYTDLWGMKHFAMARLLTPGELAQMYPDVDVEEGLLYLELTHHPTLRGAKAPYLSTNKSILPLQESHLKALSEHMTTCRFSVNQGLMHRVGFDAKGHEQYLPKLPNVPDGLYEIQNGQAYQLPFPRIPILGIFTNGFAKALPKDHPLYSQELEILYKLFNLGFEPYRHFLPMQKDQRAIPSRYAYFRNGDFYLMGGKIMDQSDPLLQAYVAREKTTQTPFVDQGPPSLDEIRQFGLKIPDKMYLALGDNHAMSADSREFGFVPEDNLKGGVSVLFAPVGARWGQPMQPSQPHATFPNLAIWGAFTILLISSSIYLRRKMQKPLQF